MLNIKDYSNIFIIEKRENKYTIKEYIGNIDGVLHIPHGITHISKHAFTSSKCSKISKIVFPNTLNTISEANFNWDNLTEVEIPEGITAIAKEAFLGSGIQEVILPSTIEKIGKGAFSCCQNLKKVTINKLNSLLLNSILTDENYSSWNWHSEYKERKLNFSLYFGTAYPIKLDNFHRYYDAEDEKSKFSIQNGFILYGNCVVGYIGKETAIQLPNNAIGIAYESFMGNTIIQSVTLNEKMEYIGDAAFKDCTSLLNIKLNETLHEIGSSAFSNTMIDSIVIPSNVSFVGAFALSYCKRLKMITIEYSIWNDKQRTFKWDKYWNYGFYYPLNYALIR